MPDETIRPSEKQAHLIVEEVLSKVYNYESRMTHRLTRWVEAAELYSGRTATAKENSKTSPNSAELFKSIRAARNMIMRMLLGQKPCFELEAMDVAGHYDPAKLLKAEYYIANQLDLARFNRNMARTIDQLLLYGTVAIHEQYEPLRASFLGRKNWVTTFRPLSLINCAFALDAYDIEESGWVALSDVQSKSELNKLVLHDPKEEIYNHARINEIRNEDDYRPKVNQWVQQRLAWQGYQDAEFKNGIERCTYYGPLDCMNDNSAEYCVEIINRKAVIRMASYEGLRPVRIAAIDTLDVEPLGNGMYDKFAPMLKKIDDTESSLLNMITLAGANMFAKQKSLSDEQTEFVIRQLGIMDLENPDLRNIAPDGRNLSAVAAYLVDGTQKYRQAAGTPDTLQAIVEGEQTTATAVSLAMNEAVRNWSVQAEIIAPVLIQDHVKVVMQSAQKYNTEPFVLNVNGVPVNIMPSDLWIDVNVRVKTTTDQDFRPAKLQRLREGIMMMASVPPPPGKKYNPGPAMEEYFKTLQVPKWNESIQDVTDEDLLAMRLQAEMGAQIPAGEPGAVEPSPEPEGTLDTPVGEVMSVPGDQQSTKTAIRKSGVGIE